ncbi:MAG: TIGR04551 family protein, partial [Myxococcales bacterium]
MNRLLALSLVLLAAPAVAQTGAAPARPPARTPPAQPAPAAEPPAAEEQQAPPPAQSQAPAIDREQIRREVLEDVRQELAKQREEVRDEVRAQLTTQAANRALEDEFQMEEKRKLELFEFDGYFRIRPDFLYNLSLSRGPDPSGFHLFPPPIIGGDLPKDQAAKSQASADMRLRFEPTLNVSEDLQIKAQIDVFDNLVFGTTPEGAFTLSERVPIMVFTQSQVPPEGGRNAPYDAIRVKRLWGEVMTPFGQLRAGRMGSHWGLGMLANDGNCLDCDHGDSADRVMFVTKVFDHYVVPIVDFVSEGPTNARAFDAFGQFHDRDQLDDARNYILAVARRDSELEVQRKLAANQSVINYGLYFVYRTQQYDSASYYKQGNVFGGDVVGREGFVPREATAYVPDLWFKFVSGKLRIELELVGVFGKIGNSAPIGEFRNKPSENAALTILQAGAVLQTDYKILDNLLAGVELGFASGDKAPGFGNKPGRGGPTVPGNIDGYQFNVGNGDLDITNFRFNRDYRVDLILWRNLLNGVTDAIYVKPSVRYEVREGLNLMGNVIYSRAVYGQSTPSAVVTAEGVQGDPNLGVELDAGVSY